MSTISSKLQFTELIHDGLTYAADVTNVLHTSQSDFQAVQVIDTKPFGRCLFLDGQIQSAKVDEFMYHESLVHPAMALHGKPKKVFIGGGGEGATLREVLRHPSVERCVMVDIDGVAVDACRRELPDWSAGAFEDSRAELVIADAMAWLKNSDEQFDVIIFDLADPLDDGPCYKLYATEFYKQIVTPRLAEGGVLVTQAGPGGVLSSSQVFTAIHNTWKASFAHVAPYRTFIQSFCDMWAYVIASNKPLPTLTAEELDARLTELLGADGVAQLRHYDGESHRHMFSLPKALRKALADETRVITYDKPLYVHN